MPTLPQPSSSQRADGGGGGGGARIAQTEDGDLGAAAETRPRAIGDLDAVDRTVTPGELDGPRAPAGTDELAHAQALRRTAVEEHVEVEDLDVVVAHLERERAEAAFAAADADHVAVDAEADRLLAQQLPLLASAVGTTATIVTRRPAIPIETGRTTIAIVVGTAVAIRGCADATSASIEKANSAKSGAIINRQNIFHSLVGPAAAAAR